MALALMGASDEVFIVSAAFGMWNGKFNHANLPMVSMPVWDWFFCYSAAASLSSCVGAPPSRFQLRL